MQNRVGFNVGQQISKVGADLCVRPFVWISLYNFFVLHPSVYARN